MNALQTFCILTLTVPWIVIQSISSLNPSVLSSLKGICFVSRHEEVHATGTTPMGTSTEVWSIYLVAVTISGKQNQKTLF